MTLAAVVLTGCASGSRAADPQLAVAKLEAKRAKRPDAPAALRALGVAYYTAQRFPEARAVLDTARQRDARDGVAALYAGLAAEAQQDWAGARASYAQYLGAGKAPKVREQIRQRLAYVNKLELAATAKAAVAAESQLGGAPGDPTTIAVPPFRVAAADTTLQPLGRGLADLLITDLALAPRLTVVERERMQALVDEIGRSSGGRVDQETALRAGRMLQAGRIVQGGVTQPTAQTLQLDAAVVDVRTAAAVGSGSADDALEQLFEAEKRLALQVLQSLGIDLTPDQRASLERRPTRSLPAFLAYSRGLLAEDNGDYAEAARRFAEAFRIDPGFLRANSRAQGATAAAAGSQVNAGTIESAVTSSPEGPVVGGAKNGEIVELVQVTPGSTGIAVANLNPSAGQQQTTSTQPATGGGSATGGTSQPPPTAPTNTNPTTQPPPVSTGTVVIVIPRP